MNGGGIKKFYNLRRRAEGFQIRKRGWSRPEARRQYLKRGRCDGLRKEKKKALPKGGQSQRTGRVEKESKTAGATRGEATKKKRKKKKKKKKKKVNAQSNSVGQKTRRVINMNPKGVGVENCTIETGTKNL